MKSYRLSRRLSGAKMESGSVTNELPLRLLWVTRSNNNIQLTQIGHAHKGVGVNAGDDVVAEVPVVSGAHSSAQIVQLLALQHGAVREKVVLTDPYVRLMERNNNTHMISR